MHSNNAPTLFVVGNKDGLTEVRQEREWVNSDQLGPSNQSVYILFLRCEITDKGFHGVLFYSAWVLLTISNQKKQTEEAENPEKSR